VVQPTIGGRRHSVLAPRAALVGVAAVGGSFEDAKSARVEIIDKLRKGGKVRSTKATFESFASE